ncbi:MAG: type IV toxin-antitoxin system AbiEi family antitoxin [Microbacterium sp.]
MVKTMRQRENLATAVLRNAIPTSLHPESTPSGVTVSIDGRSIVLRAVWVGEGFPADVVRVLESLETDDPAGSPLPVVTARRMSPGAIQLLGDRGIAWADAEGQAEISTPDGIHIYRLKPQRLPHRTAGVSWSRSSQTVAEYVLSRRAMPPLSHVRGWNGVDRVMHIAEATGISQGQVAKTLVSFDEEGYTAKFGPERGPTSSRELRDPGRLLSDWTGHFTRMPRKDRRAELHTLSRDPHAWIDIVRSRLDTVPWVTSGWLAADAVAPFATSIPDLLVYVQETDFEHARDALTSQNDISEVERGARIHLHSAPHHVIAARNLQADIPVASPVRIYADLVRAGGRGADAAEHLREVSIGF